MATLDVTFKQGFFGIGKRRGSITISDAAPKIRRLVGGWRGFPKDLVSEMDVSVRRANGIITDLGRVVISGNPEGKIPKMTLPIGAVSVQFDLYNMSGEKKWQAPGLIFQTAEGNQVFAPGALDLIRAKQTALRDAIVEHLDPRLRNLSDWKQVGDLVDKQKDILRHPIATNQLPGGFRRWLNTKTYNSPPGHLGHDFHVYEDMNGQPRFLPCFTPVSPILPGILITGEDYLYPLSGDVSQNSISVLHSFPRTGDRALISRYAHVGSENRLKIGEPPQEMRVGKWKVSIPLHKETHLHHLHFSIGYVWKDTLSALIKDETIYRRGADFESDFGWVIRDDFIRAEDPQILFPSGGEPPQFAWFDKRGLHLSTSPRQSIVRDPSDYSYPYGNGNTICF